MKVKLFDKVVVSKSTKILGVGGGVVGATSALFSDVVSEYGIFILIAWGILYIISHLIIWFRENRIKSLKLKINDSEVEIVNGDILEGTNISNLRVISFNEYFDTLVDEKIISSGSINGQFIKSLGQHELDELKNKIKNDSDLNKKKKCINSKRQAGEQQKYKIGSILNYQEKYLLTAFSKFDENNRATLTLAEYIEFLMEFWSEIDRVYAGRTIELSLLGGGITRFPDTGNLLTHQELIENILWTFKISRLKFSYPAKIRILLYDNGENNEMDKINLIKLREMYKDG